jgi:hypothetical protein
MGKQETPIHWVTETGFPYTFLGLRLGSRVSPDAGKNRWWNELAPTRMCFCRERVSGPPWQLHTSICWTILLCLSHTQGLSFLGLLHLLKRSQGTVKTPSEACLAQHITKPFLPQILQERPSLGRTRVQGGCLSETHIINSLINSSLKQFPKVKETLEKKKEKHFLLFPNIIMPQTIYSISALGKPSGVTFKARLQQCFPMFCFVLRY